MLVRFGYSDSDDQEIVDKIYHCKIIGGYFCNIAYPTERYDMLLKLEG